MKPLEDTRLLTVRDVAQRLNVSVACVYVLVEKRQIPHVRIGVGRGIIRFQPDDIAAYLAAQRIDTTQRAATPPRVRLKHIKVRK